MKKQFIIILSVFLIFGCTKDELSELKPQVSTNSNSKPVIPRVITSDAFELGLKTGTISARVDDDIPTEVLEKGFMYSTIMDKLDSADRIKVDTSTNGYKLKLQNLKPNTRYYYKAYAKNSSGIGLGEIRSFSTEDYILSKVSTDSVGSISFYSANLYANVSDDGGTNVSERGFIFGKKSNLAITDTIHKLGVGKGRYELVINGLEPNTKYYFKSYSKNEGGYSYGNELSFTTIAYTPAVVTTNDISEITTTSARIGLAVENSGNTDITERGVVIGTNTEPTIKDKKIQMGNGIGGIMDNIFGLEPNTTYYIRGYAVNRWGIVYGSVKEFKTAQIVVITPPIVINPTPSAPSEPAPSTPVPVNPTPVFTPEPTQPTPPPTLTALPEYVSVPDSRFEQALIDRGYDFILDGRIKTASIANATVIEILTNYGITNIAGVEAFPNLQKLRIIHNNISSVDLSKNINLTWVSFWDNKLTSIDVSSLSKLEYFGAGDNDIVTFDVSRNQNLTELDFGNTEGRDGYGTTRGVTFIDITHNPNLQRLYMQNNRLTALNLSGNPIIKEIWVHDNKIESLDCTNNSILSWFAVWNNNLRYMNIKALPSIFIDRLYTYNNPNLTEIKVQSVQKLLQKKSDCGGCFYVDSWTKYVE